MENPFDYNFNSFLVTIDSLKKIDEEKAKIIKHFLNKLKDYETSSRLEDREIQGILECFEVIQKNISCFSKYEELINEHVFLYSLTETIFSYSSPLVNVYCLASKENIQKLMSFIYEKSLKPYVFKNWWLIFDNKIDYLNDFTRSIPLKFLQSYYQEKLNSLDTSLEDQLINNFFSQKVNWPTWIGETKKIKIVEINSEKIDVFAYDIFWVIVDSIANRIRYKLWEGFVNYLLNYFDLEKTDIKQWNNIENSREEVYDLYLNCYKLPELIMPVIKEILAITKKERKEKYQRFLNLDKI